MTGTRFGYTLMTEQSGPRELVDYAGAAERAGFDFEVMSDHYFPWLDAQGHAAYAWSILGAVTQVTDEVGLMTYVTCPTMRYHPAVLAQKAPATPGSAGTSGGSTAGASGGSGVPGSGAGSGGSVTTPSAGDVPTAGSPPKAAPSAASRG